MSQTNTELRSTLPMNYVSPVLLSAVQLMLEIYATRTSTQSRSGGIMAKSRREFLADASAGLFGAAVVAHAQNQKPTTPKPRSLAVCNIITGRAARHALRVRHCSSSRPRSIARNFRRSRKTGAHRTHRSRARASRRQLAPRDGRALRTPHRPEKSRARINAVSRVALGSRAPRHESRPGPRSIYPQQE